MNNLELLFTIKNDNEILCTIGTINDILIDWQTFVKEYSDSIVTDRFYIVDHINTKKDTEGNIYNWYIIDHHYHTVDYTPRLDKKDEELTKIQEDTDELLVDQEYRLALMEVGV